MKLKNYIFAFAFFLISTTTICASGIDVKITKKSKKTNIYRVYFPASYANKLSKLNYRDANIFIKKVLIKAYRKMGLKSYEISKYHIFIKKKDLINYKKGSILWIQINYKARTYTKVYIKISKSQK